MGSNGKKHRGLQAVNLVGSYADVHMWLSQNHKNACLFHAFLYMSVIFHNKKKVLKALKKKKMEETKS